MSEKNKNISIIPILSIVFGLGLLAGSYFAFTSQIDGVRHFFFSYLASFCFFFTISMGALFFLLIQHLTQGVWNVVVRRKVEIIASAIPLLAILFIPIVLGMTHLFPWADTARVAGNHLLEHKQPYLNPTFFIARWIVFFLLWSAIYLFFFRKSLAQDRTGEPELVLHMKRASGPAMAIFALTFTFASFDLVMSLTPEWFSSILGVYLLISGCVGFFALLSLSVSDIGKSFTAEHQHELGKYLFGFVFFWGYIAFSQYLLMWFGNIPEETVWYIPRHSGQWGIVSLVLVFGNFLLPFLALVTGQAKRIPAILKTTALWLLVMHWLNMRWFVIPNFAPGNFVFAVPDILCFAGIFLVYFGFVRLVAAGKASLPENDPRLEKAIAFISGP